MRLDRRQFLLATAAAPLLRAADPPAAARVRSMMRLFISEVEDKPWFYDREMWPAYLAMLAENRFNRFQPRVRHRLRFPARRDRRLLPLRLSVLP